MILTDCPSESHLFTSADTSGFSVSPVLQVEVNHADVLLVQKINGSKSVRSCLITKHNLLSSNDAWSLPGGHPLTPRVWGPAPPRKSENTMSPFDVDCEFRDNIEPTSCVTEL